MKVIISDKAKKDLFDIARFIGANNLLRAKSFVDELTNSCYALSNMPRVLNGARYYAVMKLDF